jgi:integrase
VYGSRVAGFVAWAKDNAVDSGAPTVPIIARFLEHLFTVKKLSPSTVRGYKAALADYYAPEVVDIRGSQELTRLLNGFFHEKPPSGEKVLPWDLRLVLDALKRPPFEPMQTADLKTVTYKTVFLLSFATGRRRSELHALDFNSFKQTRRDGIEFYSFSPVLGFRAKNQKASEFNSTAIMVPSLKDHLGPDLAETSDKFLCPVRALKYYMNKTQSLRSGKSRLFISHQPGKTGDITQSAVSSWIRNTIQMAYQAQTGSSELPQGTRPHQVRSAASSWALKGGVSMPRLMDACFWHSQSTFTSYYLKDCWTQGADKFSLGPTVSAGSVVQL